MTTEGKFGEWTPASTPPEVPDTYICAVDAFYTDEQSGKTVDCLSSYPCDYDAATGKWYGCGDDHTEDGEAIIRKWMPFPDAEDSEPPERDLIDAILDQWNKKNVGGDNKRKNTACRSCKWYDANLSDCCDHCYQCVHWPSDRVDNWEPKL